MKKIIVSTITVIFSFLPWVVHAGYGLESTAKEAGIKPQGEISDVAGNVIGSGLTLIGVLFFILMIYAGIKWMLARGNEEQSKKALETITAAIIGLIIVIASYAITRFVFQSVGGQTSGGPGAGGVICCVYTEGGTDVPEVVNSEGQCLSRCENNSSRSNCTPNRVDSAAAC